MATEKFREIKEAYELLKNYYLKKENLNAPFEKNFKKEEITFVWNNYSFTIDETLIKYNVIRSKVQFLLYDISKKYESLYKSYGNLDAFIEQDKNQVIDTIYKTFEYIVKISIENGYDVLSAKILSNKYSSLILKDYFRHFNSLEEKIRELKVNYEAGKEIRKYRDIFNNNNDFLGKINRGIENFQEGYKITEIERQVYEDSDTLNTFKNDVIKGVLSCIEVVTSLLGLTQNLKINILLSQSILDNIFNYKDDQREKKILEALLNNPYNEKVYIAMLNLLGDSSNETEKIAEYFGMRIVKLEKNKRVSKAKQEFEKDIYKDIEKAKIKFIEKLKFLGINYKTFDKYIEECIVKKYINEFKKEVKIDIDEALFNFKNNISLLGLDFEKYKEYINDNIVLIYKQEFEKIIKIDIDKALFDFKNNITLLGLDFEKYREYINNKVIPIYKQEFEEMAKIDITKAKQSFKNNIEKLNLNYDIYVNYEKSIEKKIKLEENEKMQKKESKEFLNILLKVWLFFTFFLGGMILLKGRSRGIIDSLIGGMVLAAIPYGLPVFFIAFYFKLKKESKEEITLKEGKGCLSILILFILVMSYIIFSDK